MADTAKSYCAYVITNDRGDVYVGSTSNLDLRMFSHNHNHVRWTAYVGGPWRLIHSEPKASKHEAQAKERSTWRRIIDRRPLPFIDFTVTRCGPDNHIDHFPAQIMPKIKTRQEEAERRYATAETYRQQATANSSASIKLA
jgi:predicted GIY-YIG superfamily endonuclease